MKKTMAPYEVVEFSTSDTVSHVSEPNTIDDNNAMIFQEENIISGTNFMEKESITHVRFCMDGKDNVWRKVPIKEVICNDRVSYNLLLKEAANSFQLQPNQIGQLKSCHNNAKGQMILLLNDDDVSAAILDNVTSTTPKSLLDVTITANTDHERSWIATSLPNKALFLLQVCFLMVQLTFRMNGLITSTMHHDNSSSLLLHKFKSMAAKVLQVETSMVNVFVESFDGSISSIETEMDLVNTIHNNAHKDDDTIMMNVVLSTKNYIHKTNNFANNNPKDMMHSKPLLPKPKNILLDNARTCEATTVDEETTQILNAGPSFITLHYNDQHGSFRQQFNNELIFDSRTTLPYEKLISLVTTVVYQHPFKKERLTLTHVRDDQKETNVSSPQKIRIQNNNEFVQTVLKSSDDNFVIDVSFTNPAFIKVVHDTNGTATFGLDSITNANGMVSLDELKEMAARAVLGLSCRAEILTVKATTHDERRVLGDNDDFLRLLRNADGDLAVVELETPKLPLIVFPNSPSPLGQNVSIAVRNVLLNHQPSITKIIEQLGFLQKYEIFFDLAMKDKSNGMKVLSDHDLEKLYLGAVAQQQPSVELFIQPKPDSTFLFNRASSNLLLPSLEDDEFNDMMWWSTRGMVFPGQYRAKFLVSPTYVEGLFSLRAGIVIPDRSIEASVLPVSTVYYPGNNNNKTVTVTTRKMDVGAEHGEMFVISSADTHFELLSDVTLEYIAPLCRHE